MQSYEFTNCTKSRICINANINKICKFKCANISRAFYWNTQISEGGKYWDEIAVNIHIISNRKWDEILGSRWGRFPLGKLISASADHLEWLANITTEGVRRKVEGYFMENRKLHWGSYWGDNLYTFLVLVKDMVILLQFVLFNYTTKNNSSDKSFCLYFD